MIYREDCTLPKKYLERFFATGLEAIPEMIRLLINAPMQIERAEHIPAEP